MDELGFFLGASSSPLNIARDVPRHHHDGGCTVNAVPSPTSIPQTEQTKKERTQPLRRNQPRHESSLRLNVILVHIRMATFRPCSVHKWDH